MWVLERVISDGVMMDREFEFESELFEWIG